MAYMDLLKKIWEQLYDPNQGTATTIEQFFHPDYQQCVNGVWLNRSQYIEHVLEQKQNMTLETIEYANFLEKDNELFAVYFPKGKNKEGSALEAEVFAYVRFEKQKIIHIYAQVRLIQGNLADVDMQN